MSPIQLQGVRLDAAPPALVWQGGSGTPVLLIHGGWAGAQAHWAPVWDRLAAWFHVIAPELPGIGADTGSPPSSSYGAYVDWLDHVLGHLGQDGALVIGNSFGATLAWLLALHHPSRCRAPVMVDGFAPPVLPAPVRWLMRLGVPRRATLAHLRKHVFGPSALTSEFADPTRAPLEVRECLQRGGDARVDAMFDIVLASRKQLGRPRQPALIVWGQADHLPNAGVGVGARLHRSWTGSRWAAIEAAGHLPQVEQPDRFLAVLECFLADSHLRSH